MFCPKCGSPIPEDTVFCMNCGEKIETAAPEADSAPAEITPAEKAPIPTSGKKPKKRRPFSSFPCSHFCLSPWLLPTAACSKATLPQKRKSVSSAAGTEYFWKMETIPSAQKISVALPAPLKRVVRLQFHSQNAPFLIYPST